MFKFRPWGFWLVLWQWPLFSKGPRYKLKLLYFKKGGAISMQRHFKRSETWRFMYGLNNGHMRRGWFIPGEILSRSKTPVLIFAGEWHKYQSSDGLSLVLETQRGICREDDIERANI